MEMKAFIVFIDTHILKWTEHNDCVGQVYGVSSFPLAALEYFSNIILKNQEPKFKL
jgi:hypothetical protein